MVGLAGMSRLTTYAAEEEQLRVTLYDEYGRKILIKDGASWGIEKDIVLTIPIEELETGEGKISVHYESESSDMNKDYAFGIVKK